MAGEVIPAERSSRKTERVARAVMSMLAIGAGVGLLAKSTHISRYDRLASTFHASDFEPKAKDDFNYLVSMKPYQYDTSTTQYHQWMGEDIQDATSTIFLAGLRAGLDNKGVAIDMVDVFNQLVPADTRQALLNDGFVFPSETPVNCDSAAPNGDHGYQPLDYSNHLESDLAVQTTNDGQRLETVVPLGAEELTAPVTPYFLDGFHDESTSPLYPDYLFPHFDVRLPCVDVYPHHLYGINQTTFPADTDLQMMAW
jgi:hypothetical protein